MSAISVAVEVPTWLLQIGMVAISIRLIGAERTEKLASSVGDIVKRLTGRGNGTEE